MALTQPEINQLKSAYRTIRNYCDANDAAMSVDIVAAAPNGFTATFHALDGEGNDLIAPTSFTSQNLTLEEAINAYRQLRASGQI